MNHVLVVEEIEPDGAKVSTNGLGVAWLHVRLDTRPKYYTFQPYRTMA